MLITETLFGTEDKVAESIKLLQEMEPPEGYYLAFSGGKDSIVIKKLADMAGVKYEAHYNVTTIDPPELVYFIREHYADVSFDLPEQPFLSLLPKKGFPQRQRRWCCAVYKEAGGNGRVVVTGIRAAESAKRAKRKSIEICYRGSGKRYVNPILTWSDDEVWEFIHRENMPYCCLYDEGWKRIGCMFCPMSPPWHRVAEAERYPGYARAFEKSFEKMYQDKIEKGLTSIDRWKDGKEMFRWWIEETSNNEDPDQGVLFE